MKHAIFGFQRVTLEVFEILDRLRLGEWKIVRVCKRLPRFPGFGDFIRRVTQNLGKVLAAFDRVGFQIPIVVETVRSLLGDMEAVIGEQQLFL